ncbi:selenium binding protein [Teladorsagia circumcincta]|uniref:Selenium binding protein n=1 Tax=Teladorsagia circumcincta TaxID=45464 RepID=A0A2G9U3M6_TELCI|nr:selenium binding protein [Teladorsagia circumcincta]
MKPYNLFAIEKRENRPKRAKDRHRVMKYGGVARFGSFPLAITRFAPSGVYAYVQAANAFVLASAQTSLIPGNFLLIDGETFEPKGCWLDSESRVPFNYDFWYQPRRDVMISTEWGTPHVIKQGFDPKDVAAGEYGHSVHFFKWSTHEHLQTIELPITEGAMVLETRFLHEPTSPYAFAGTTLGSCIFLFHPKFASTKYDAKCVVKVPSKKVEGWMLPLMPSLITDIIISMDDHYLYISNWLHGDVRQYDITDPENPRLNSQIFLGGSIHTESGVTIIEDEELTEAPPARYVKGKRVEGGPQMLQVSLDGKRLYVTTSLYRRWDEQFYPNLVKKGAMMLQVDIGYDGKMTLNENFLVDFGELEGGPYLAHEMRYPGGDCTSDIWL